MLQGWRAKARREYWRIYEAIERERPAGGVFFHDRFPGYVNLSFDDGPRENHTEVVSRLLRDRGISATFFVEGWRVRAYPEIVRALDADGHVLGNHTYTHRLAPGERFSILRTAGEIVRTQRAIDHVLRDRYPKGYPHRFFRPPHGFPWSREGTRAERRKLTKILAGLSHELILWQVDSDDWSFPDRPERVVANCRDRLAALGGGIVLFHDAHPGLPEILTGLIDLCEAAGYRIVDLPTLLERPGGKAADEAGNGGQHVRV